VVSAHHQNLAVDQAGGGLWVVATRTLALTEAMADFLAPAQHRPDDAQPDQIPLEGRSPLTSLRRSEPPDPSFGAAPAPCGRCPSPG